MRRILIPALFALLALALPANPQEPPVIAKADPLTPAEEIKKFRLPPGFEIQLVASEPDIIKPMNLAFDDRGRLLVTQSIEYPFPAKGAPTKDTVKILEDFGPDGRARKIRTYVSDLSIPIGVTPIPKGAIVYSIPKIWKFTEENDSGMATRKEPLYGDVGTRDTHGMTNAFTPWIDGWVYACHGFSNDSTIKSATTESSIHIVSGNTYRWKTDGSRLEQYTHGQVNPFGLCFDPLGNLFSADCHSMPSYQLLRGGYYPTFGGEHDGLGVAPAHMSHLHGSTAIAGIVYYSHNQFPAKYKDTIFVGNVVTCRINHDRLEKHGSSFKAIEEPDFLISEDMWFRPVDMKIAPDGSLYVADFYNRIIGHYEVPLTHPGRDHERGRIWRIVYTGPDATPPKPMADLFAASADDLIGLLKDENLVVRVKATNQLVDRIGAAAVEPVKRLLSGDSHPYQRGHGLWILERLGALDEALVKKLAADSDRLVRVHVVKVLAERKKWTYEPGLVLDLLKDPEPFVRRAAAEALGLHPDRQNIEPLLRLWGSTPADDTHLIHMARMALRNQLAAVGYGALADLKVDAAKIANVSQGVRNEESATFVFGWMQQAGSLDASLLRYITRYAPQATLPAIFEYAKRLTTRTPRDQMTLLRSLQQGCQERGMKLAQPVIEIARAAIGSALGTEDKGLVTDALKLCRDVKLEGAFEDVEKLAKKGKSQELRTAAFDALAALNGAKAVGTLSAIASTAAEMMTIRQKAAASLGGINSAESRAELVKLLQAAPQPLAVQVAIGLAGSREGTDLLLTAVTEGKASPRLLTDKAVDGRIRALKDPGLVERLEKRVKDLPPEDQRINDLIKARQKGYFAAKPNAAHGAEIFLKTCGGCHKIDGKGQKIGPELDAVYTRGVERLLEDILDPNRNVDQAFRASIIKTTDGRVISGLVLREEGEVLVIHEAADKETRLPKKEIEKRVLSELSPMPTNVVDPLSEPDFYDLLAYLLQPRGQK